MRLEQTGWMEVCEKLKKPQGIILATGSTEQHGPIGLIGTDTICSETIASDVAIKANIYLAPSIGFTPAEFNMKFPGTISISVQTFKSLLREVTSSLLKHGFKYVLIVNGHGANIDPIKEVMITTSPCQILSIMINVLTITKQCSISLLRTCTELEAVCLY